VKVAVVSGADAAFFALLKDLVVSVRERIPAAEVDLAILDAGLTDDQREQLTPLVDRIARPDWDLRPAGSAPDYIKCFDSRPMLPKYLPGYDIYVWIDADAWVQDRAAVDLLIQGASNRQCAVSPELHPGYEPVYSNLNIRYRRFGRVKIYFWAHEKYGRAFGERAMRAYAWRPLLNSGVFALHRDAPHWEAWIDSYRRALRGDPTIWVNQVAFNHAVYSRGLEAEYLPAWCNWVCARGLPAFNPATGEFVEPYVPHQRIGILHMAWNTKHGTHELATTTGGKVRRSLRRPADQKEKSNA